MHKVISHPPLIDAKTRPRKCGERMRTIELGLAVLEAMAKPGVPMNMEVIAKATGLTQQAVHNTCTRALHKLRRHPDLSSTNRNHFRSWSHAIS